MTVVIEKIASEVNFVGQIIGHVYETSVFDSKDTMSILGCLCEIIGSHDDAKITFSEE